MERAEIYRQVASGLRPAHSSFRAWMPSKMATSFFFKRSGSPRRSLRIWRANSKRGTMIVSPRESLAKWSLSRSMSMHRGDSKSMEPSFVRGTVLGLSVLK